MEADKPDPRFKEYTEIEDESGNKIGFKLEGNDFLFKYDEKGGWYDEEQNYFSKHGVFMYKEEDWDNPDEAVQEQVVKQFQDMIIKEEGGKSESEDSESSEEELPKVHETIQQKIHCVVDEILKGNSLKESKKDKPLRIYIRIKKPKEEQRPSIQKTYGVDKISDEVKKSRLNFDSLTKKLEEGLPKQAKIAYSIQEGKVYWVGYVEAEQKQFNTAFQQLSQHESFGILKKKTLLHLNFFVDRKEEDLRQKKAKLLEQLKDKKDTIKINIKNLTELPPVSYAVDLLDECGVQLEEVQSIKMEKDSFEVAVPVEKAPNIIELVSYEKGEKQYVVVELAGDGEPKVQSPYYTVKIEDEKCKTMDLLTQMLVYSDLDCVAKPGLGTITIHQNFLRALLLVREDSFVPISISKIKFQTS